MFVDFSQVNCLVHLLLTLLKFKIYIFYRKIFSLIEFKYKIKLRILKIK